MKYLITLILIGLLFGSCRDTLIEYNEIVIVTQRITHDDVICRFYTNKYSNEILGSEYYSFLDSCGKFNVGDTLKLVKL